jgi:hypothetical protein
MKSIITFFDRLEDKIRGRLSEHPIIYAFFASTGVVLVWRGIWHTADVTPILENGLVSIAVGSLILLITGVYVSAFIGNSVIMTGLRREKKLAEKTKEEIEKDMTMEKGSFSEIKKTLAHIEEELQEIRDKDKK